MYIEVLIPNKDKAICGIWKILFNRTLLHTPFLFFNSLNWGKNQKMKQRMKDLEYKEALKKWRHSKSSSFMMDA